MKVSAFVDGSFNAVTKVYGAGIVLIIDDDWKNPLKTSAYGNNEVFAKSRNVAGEVLAAIKAAQLCAKIGDISDLTIYYDYTGIEYWYKGRWKANSAIAKTYVGALQGLPFRLHFRKVAAHTGVAYNELADRLAKEACGLL